VNIARRSRYRFDARARSRGITRAQWRVLISLSRVDGPTQSDLAEMLDVERITLCRMVDRLEESGLVERRRDEADRRAWRIHLTEKARPLIDELHGLADIFNADMLDGVDEAERATASRVLARVRDNLLEHETKAKAS